MNKKIATLLTAALITVMSCGMFFTTAYAVNVSDSNTNSAKSSPTATARVTDEPTSSSKPTSTAKASSTSSPTSTAKTSSTSNPSSTAEADEDEGILEDENESTPEPLPTITPVPEQDAGFFGTKITRGGLWVAFILLVIINAIVSFMISSRFAALSKRDNHLSAEIRALRRDIDAKMSGTVGGFRENDTVIINRNKDYTNGEGVRPEKKPRVVTEDGESAEDSIPQEAIDLYAKWESQLEHSTERTERNRNVEVRSNKNKAGDKAKDVIKNIFPFGKDDE